MGKFLFAITMLTALPVFAGEMPLEALLAGTVQPARGCLNDANCPLFHICVDGRCVSTGGNCRKPGQACTASSDCCTNKCWIADQVCR
jgi:hypothetical protein